MPKTYAIADIHGRADLLSKAVDLIAEDCGQAQHSVIVLGDFVDRGPHSQQVIALLRALEERNGWRVLQGNHEAMMHQVLTGGGQLRWWFGNGGDRTMASYGYENGDRVYPLKPKLIDDLQWLAKLPVWIGDRHRIYVHAGVPFDKEVNEVDREMLQWMLYDAHHAPEHNEPALWRDEPHVSGKHIVHGHHQHASNPVSHLVHRTNLDSFAWYSGRLAIGVFDDEVAGGPVKVLDAIGMPYHRFRGDP